MNLQEMKQKAIRTGHTVGLKLKAKSPEILIGVGVAAIVGGTVMIAKAAMEHEEAVEVFEEQVYDIKLARDISENSDTVEYTEESYRKDMAQVSFARTLHLIKHYGRGATLTATGIACMLGAHNIMKKRNVAIVAAYKVVESSFEDYRERVREELGEEKDREFKYGFEKAIMESEVINPETNRKNKKKEEVTTIDKEKMSKYSAYSRLFDETNVNWHRTPSFNKMFLTAQQNYANDKLKAEGHLFLNEVYDMLGMERSSAGAVVGWVLGEDEKDGYVDFGMYDVIANDQRAEFINEREHSVLLDFNVDGVIYDLI